MVIYNHEFIDIEVAESIVRTEIAKLVDEVVTLFQPHRFCSPECDYDSSGYVERIYDYSQLDCEDGMLELFQALHTGGKEASIMLGNGRHWDSYFDWIVYKLDVYIRDNFVLYGNDGDFMNGDCEELSFTGWGVECYLESKDSEIDSFIERIFGR